MREGVSRESLTLTAVASRQIQDPAAGFVPVMSPTTAATRQPKSNSSRNISSSTVQHNQQTSNQWVAFIGSDQVRKCQVSPETILDRRTDKQSFQAKQRVEIWHKNIGC